MDKKIRVSQVTQYLTIYVCVFLLLSGCANLSYKQKAFWDGAAVGAMVGTTAGGIANHEDDMEGGAVIGMVAGGLIGGVYGMLNAKGPVMAQAVVEPVPAPKMEPAPPEIEAKPVAAEPVEPPAPPEPPKPPVEAKVKVAPPLPPPPPVQKVKERVVLRGIQFDFDKSNIKEEFVPVLDEAVRILKDRTDVKVVIGGHTCWIGDDAYNQRLSERRAKSVYTFLVEKGISKERLSSVGYGEKQPVADNQTSQGRRMNRRVEFLIMDK
jgi:outer membrane protein OmpA-like peptidoglycan-associated protein